MRKLWILASLVAFIGAAAALGARWIAACNPPALVLAPAEVDFGRVAIGDSGESFVVATNSGARRLRAELVPADGPFHYSPASLALDPGDIPTLNAQCAVAPCP